MHRYDGGLVWPRPRHMRVSRRGAGATAGRRGRAADEPVAGAVAVVNGEAAGPAPWRLVATVSAEGALWTGRDRSG